MQRTHSAFSSMQLTTNTSAGIGVNDLSLISAKKSGKCPERAPTKNNLKYTAKVTHMHRINK